MGIFTKIKRNGIELAKGVQEKIPWFSPTKGKEGSIKVPDNQFHIVPPTEWREQDINRWLKDEFFSRSKARNQTNWTRFIRYVYLELEAEKQVRLIIMTRFYIRSYIEAELVDIWHDHRTSGLVLNLKSVTLFGVPFLPQFLTRWLTSICMGIVGFLFNPVLLREGAFLRFGADNLRIDLHQYFRLSQYSRVSRYLWNEAGTPNNSFIIFGAQTEQGKLRPKIQVLSPEEQEDCRQEEEKYHAREDASQYAQKKSIFQFNDVWPLLIVAVISGYAVQFMRPYLVADVMDVSLTWSFFTSLFLLIVSIVVINIARWVYQFSLQSKEKPIKIQAEAMLYRIDRIRRDIELGMQQLNPDATEGSLGRKLIRAGRHRKKMLMAEKKLENLKRELKLKYSLAYVVTVLSEYISFRFFG